MNKRRASVLGILFAAGALAFAADPAAESPTASPVCLDVVLAGEGPGLCDFVANPAIYQHAASVDLHDLRLFDTAGRELPIAIRNRAPRSDFKAFAPREFNQVKNLDRSVAVSLDLGTPTEEHNRVEVITAGVDYRRVVLVEGSDDGATWREVAKSELRYFTAGTQVFDRRSVEYPVSRFRYLRVTVTPERGNPDDKPGEVRARVEREVRDAGFESVWPARLSARQAGRATDGYTSEWLIDLPGGELVPWETLEFEAEEKDFSRSYRLEQYAESGPWPLIASGQWERSPVKTGPLRIRIQHRAFATKLRLVVVDQRNPPLKLQLVSAKAAADQILFQRTADMTSPLRLCLGNPAAHEPGYDIGRTLGAGPVATQRATLGEVRTNPGYEPPPDPRSFLDRKPWATDTVFGIVIAALAGLLAVTARKAMRLHDGGMSGASTQKSNPVSV